jgi:hypothetical protein
MRFFGALLLLVHGVAHLVGFRAAFWPAIDSLPNSASPLAGKVWGVLWFLLALAFLACAALLVARSANFIALALAATAASLAMCTLFWPDAKIGLFINLALLVVLALFSRGSSRHLANTFEDELRGASLATSAEPGELVEERSLASLPEPVQRYLRFMGVVGKPRDVSLRASFKARFRLDPGEWRECEVLLYDTRLRLSRVARVFYMQLSLKGLLSVTARDTYLQGQGRMRVKAFDWVPIVDGRGYELDVGELVTYLNDAVLMAPSLLLGPETSWTALDAQSFAVTLRDGALSVTARVWLDERGAPKDFSTTDRFFDGPDGKRARTEWRTPVSGWQDAFGRKLPTRAQAVWQLASGPFAYADFEIDPARIAFNVPKSSP